MHDAASKSQRLSEALHIDQDRTATENKPASRNNSFADTSVTKSSHRPQALRPPYTHGLAPIKPQFGLRPRTITQWIIACGLVLLVLSPAVTGETILGEQNEEFDFDGQPGAQYDFKVFVHAGTEECFYQKVVAGAELHVRFEILKGGESNVDVYLYDPSGTTIRHKTDKEGFFHETDLIDGVYAACIDNVFDRYGYKVVYVYIGTVVMQDWFRFQEEIEKVNLMAGNFSESLSSVENSIGQMRKSQSRSRFNVVKDWYLSRNNLYYVGMWSMLQCGLIIFAAVAQVYSLRRLFRTTTTTPTTAKPRA